MESFTTIPDTGCWVWKGAPTKSGGYGQLGVREPDGTYKMVRAHRWSYEHFVGPIPKGLELDHTCCVAPCPGGRCAHRLCVNPAHLEPVTHAENVGRGNVGSNSRAKTHCPQGHPYDEVNTYRTSAGKRMCRRCSRDRMRVRRSKL